MIRRVLALARKELRQLFASPIAYVVGTAYVALTGIYFFQHLVSYNQLLFVYQSEGLTGGGFDQGTVPSHINVLNEVFVPAADDFGLFLLVVLPLVTMRVFAEERANGTDELLLTSGLRPWEVESQGLRAATRHSLELPLDAVDDGIERVGDDRAKRSTRSAQRRRAKDQRSAKRRRECAFARLHSAHREMEQGAQLDGRARAAR